MLNRAHYDRWLLLSTLVLVGFGALMVYSSTSVMTPAFSKKHISTFFYLKRHVFTMFIGIVFMYAAFRINMETLKRLALPLLIFSVILLTAVFIPGLGVTAGGAKRWLRLWPSTFQPSELVKLSMVIFLAFYMSSSGFRHDRFKSFIIPVGIMAVFQAVFLKQPDFGAAMSLGLITVVMLVLSGIRLRYIMYLLVLAIPVVVTLLNSPYRAKRITSFLDPWKHAQDLGFQLIQSYIAMGSGGITGVGLGKSRQKLSFLPESHTDFIFSLVGEELGFFAAVALVGLFLFVFIRGIKIANRTKDMFSYYLASGLSMMIALQALVNFSVATGLAPTKGLPLPFISYGGSSLLINMTAVGILLNLSKERSSKINTEVAGELIERKKALISVYGRTSWRGKTSVNGLSRSPAALHDGSTEI